MSYDYNVEKNNLLNKEEDTTDVVNNRPPMLIDKILNQYGFGIHVIKVIINSVFLYFLSSYFIYNFSCYLLIIKREFKLSSDVLTILSSLGFICKSLGCFLTGYITITVNRKILVFMNIFILLILNIILTFNFTIITYFMFIIFGCYLIGNIDPINMDVLCESLPIQFRGFFLCFTYIGFPLNLIVQYYLINIFSVKDHTNHTNIMLVNDGIIAFIFIWILLFFDDSVRNYLVKENFDIAFKRLGNLTNIPLTNEEEDLIKFQSFKVNKIIHLTSIKEMFSSQYIRITILFIILNFSFNCLTDGFSVVLNLIFELYIKDADEEKISWAGMKTYIWGFFAYPLCGFFTEISFIKRKYSLIIFTSLVGIFSSIFLINPNNFEIWISLLLLTSNSTVSLSISFVSESFPTKIRDISQGFMNSLANFGSMIGQLVFIALFSTNKTNGLMIYSIINSILMVVVISFIRNEPYSKPLDDIYDTGNQVGIIPNEEGETFKDK